MSDNDSYKIPLVKDGGNSTVLWFWNPEKEDFETDGLDLRRASDWESWIRFLETHKSFRYESGGGSFSCVKEARRGKKSDYWYAHRRITARRGKHVLKRKYLGVNKNLSSARLYKVAFELSQMELDLAD